MSNTYDCLYVNSETSNAKDMLQPCSVDGRSGWPCSGKEYIDGSILSRNLERPSGDNSRVKLVHSLTAEPIDKYIDHGKQKTAGTEANQTVEGFTNLGERYVPESQCPDGYYWCSRSRKCKQVCQNCKFNETTYGTSKEFNEYDYCQQTHQGVYNGLDKRGNATCTCGKNGQYCHNMFDTQGGMMYDDVYIVNVGDYVNVGDMVAY
jgi:hypothetical protein